MRRRPGATHAATDRRDNRIDEASGGSYGLGHTDRELDRLIAQARLIDPITRKWFLEAGISTGMRVLDVGSGVGDVALLAAGLVGDSGEVVGIDRATAPLLVASKRASESPATNIRFVVGDPCEMTFDEPFDAVVGRYVLMFQMDPTATLQGLMEHVRPGGVVFFHEPYRDGVRSFPPVPTYDRCWQLLDDVLVRTGADPTIGLKLHSVFVAAGLQAPAMRMEALVAGGSDCDAHIRYEVDPVRSVMPHIESIGLGCATDINVDTLADRVRQELIATGGVIVGRAEIAAWSRAQ
jgi:SAM-dependent methyltransferase